MIDIKKCPECQRLVLQVGNKFWHIDYKEAEYLLKRLKQLKIGKRK